ncbi:hypothetical protein [Shimia sp. SDUM112013]|uniref:hypothetical protein n=1 Tax=Shimia sp. SDUM112013 TaxID=3136160 RepID=UPI0032EE443D
MYELSRSIFVLLAGMTFAVAGCGEQHDRSETAPPAESYENFGPVGYAVPVRADEAAYKEDPAALVSYYENGVMPIPVAVHGRGMNILALSGGGQDGAFGAGVLNDWTQAGTRPQI